MCRTCQYPRDDEQQVGQAIQVAQYFGPDSFLGGQCRDAAFCTSDDRSCQVACGRCFTTAGSDEFLERRQVFVEVIEFGRQARDKLIRDGAVARNTKFTT